MSIIKVWKNKGKILEGIQNRLFRKEDVEVIHDERMEICKACPHIDTEGSKCYVPGTKPCCSKCGCSLALKLRSLSSDCGDEENPRWHAVIDEDEEEMLNDQLGLDG